ncbi:MAG: hypothetical protein IJ086_07415 [Clostridium sp.]|nr:hypothetical protein [Clostridium sp.]MBQ8998497.1 hypothetical protein [Clostridium sp.]
MRNINLMRLAESMIESSKAELLEECGDWKNNSISTSIMLDDVEDFSVFNEDVILNLSNIVLDNNDVKKIAIKGSVFNCLEFTIYFY